ncbi:hypothetical protein C8Q76DRAFT_751414 [Earliella scabrosa]|nr:hypothetical protein C8Q76DRAFT_751414 [Earliella scabrosa]
MDDQSISRPVSVRTQTRQTARTHVLHRAITEFSDSRDWARVDGRCPPHMRTTKQGVAHESLVLTTCLVSGV